MPQESDSFAGDDRCPWEDRFSFFWSSSEKRFFRSLLSAAMVMCRVLMDCNTVSKLLMSIAVGASVAHGTEVKTESDT